ncbi:hypothetical protein BDP27DRAFT_1142582, partial [Rhodocollybia butyracea]
PKFAQVGGHPNSIQTTEDGSLVIKPASKFEEEFYTVMAQARASENLKRLSKFVPEFYGTLKQEGGDDDGKYLVLANILHQFTKPNLLDLKLGTVMYDALDPTYSPEKKTRMEKKAKETTSGECGMCLIGFQVHPQPASLNEAIITPKPYGKSLRKDDLPEGIRRVFPVLGEPLELYQAATRTDLGLPSPILLQILRAMHSALTRLKSVFEQVEIRMAGGSLLVVYEGDEERARESVSWMDTGEDSDGDEDESDASDSDDESTRVGPPFRLYLIDFAHTHFVPGQGPDKGVLLGMQTFIGLIEGRI